VKIPLIIYDPSNEADVTRGTACDELVEAIDLAPTFLEAFGGNPAEQSHRLEGRSLIPLLSGTKPATWRSHVFSEYDYSIQYGAAFKTMPSEQRLFMVADEDWKYVHAIGYRPMLFDLKNDHHELRDLGADPKFADVCQRYAKVLAEWGLRQSQRVTRSEQQVRAMRGRAARFGILIGVWDESDLADEYWVGYRGDGSV